MTNTEMMWFGGIVVTLWLLWVLVILWEGRK